MLLISQVNRKQADFIEREQAMQRLVADLYAKCEQITAGGSAQAQKKHLARGKLLPRQRIDRLLDVGSPFLEIGQFAAFECYDQPVPAAGLIAGIGLVR